MVFTQPGDRLSPLAAATTVFCRHDDYGSAREYGGVAAQGCGVTPPRFATRQVAFFAAIAVAYTLADALRRHHFFFFLAFCAIRLRDTPPYDVDAEWRPRSPTRAALATY